MRCMEATFPRRWFQFSLRTCLIILTLLAFWLGYVSIPAREQRAAVARINELGGSLQYDYQVGSNPDWSPAGWTALAPKQIAMVGSDPTSSPAGWPWLRRLVGDEYFQDVVYVNLDQSEVRDADFCVLGKLRGTKTLSLNGTDISDEGLASIRGMSELNYLGLMKTKVMSEGVRRLPPPRNGSIVLLGDTRVGDEALTNLSGCVHLGLDGTRITSQGVKQMANFKNLRVLSLQRTVVDDEAVPFLAQLTALERLDLRDTEISGEGLFLLRNALPKCRIEGAWVNLSYLGTYNHSKIEFMRSKGLVPMKIVQSSQEHPIKLLIFANPLVADMHLSLLDIDRLEVLDLRGASVTDEGVQMLQQTSPRLKIYR